MLLRVIKTVFSVRTLKPLLVVLIPLFITGCQRQSELEYVSSSGVKELDTEFQKQIVKVLLEKSGTPARTKMVGYRYYVAPKKKKIEKLSPEEKKKLNQKAKERLSRDRTIQSQLFLGAAVYTKRCVQCHGVSGDGAGVAADYLFPRPRDYRKGIFKFTTTPYGLKPRRSDLKDTIIRGIRGTSMPSFKLLSKEEMEAVVEYVLALTHRGELEEALAYEIDSEEELDPDVIPDFVDEIKEAWEEAEVSVVHPLTLQPEFTMEHVERGKVAFKEKGCVKCHGDDGRGQTKGNIGTDGWSFPTQAADLTSGMLHGGQKPIDIYRRILSGINGTPMPGFKSLLQENPDTAWDLVSFVLYISNERRRGGIPPAGLVNPYPSSKPIEVKTDDDDDEEEGEDEDDE